MEGRAFWSRYWQLFVDKAQGRQYLYDFSAYLQKRADLPEPKKESTQALVAGRPKPAPMDSPLGILSSFIGAFLAILTVAGLHSWSQTQDTGIEVSWIVMSFGAAAVLLFAKPGGELSAPRNAIFGQVLSAFVGVCWRNVFHYALGEDESRFLFFCAALSVASAIVVMVRLVDFSFKILEAFDQDDSSSWRSYSVDGCIDAKDGCLEWVLVYFTACSVGNLGFGSLCYLRQQRTSR
jgi:hypothetical protein